MVVTRSRKSIDRAVTVLRGKGTNPKVDPLSPILGRPGQGCAQGPLACDLAGSEILSALMTLLGRFGSHCHQCPDILMQLWNLLRMTLFRGGWDSGTLCI